MSQQSLTADEPAREVPEPSDAFDLEVGTPDLVRLYLDEIGKAPLLDAATEVDLADLADEQLVLPHRSGWTPDVEQRDWPAMSEREAVEVVASGGGIVLLPMSVARLLHRKDVASRPVSDLPPTRVALAWRVERDDEQTQAMVGVVRGRTGRSSRG